ncbi:MAG TPA: hypothetical protein VEF04_06225, partial [Blastocatellia bacterium]|nr:hypothetical protein [Blastocatellia bacterium]
KRFGESFDQTLSEIIVNPENWKDTLRSFASNFFNDLFSSMQEQFLKKMTGKSSIGAWLGDLLGGFLSGLLGGGKAVSGALASGGPVQSGKTYLVGEKGPELFTAKENGQIIPNHALEGQKKKGFKNYFVDALISPFKFMGKPLVDFYGPILKNTMPDFLKENKRLAISLLAAPLLATPLAPLALLGMPALALPKSGLSRLGKIFGGFRAEGGPVSAGSTYMVGERGPEMYVPRGGASGYHVEHKNITIVNNISVQAQGGNVPHQTQQQIATKVAQATTQALRRNG